MTGTHKIRKHKCDTAAASLAELKCLTVFYACNIRLLTNGRIPSAKEWQSIAFDITGYKNVGDLVFMVPAGYNKMLLV